ncbi:aromatic ring-hydroxylating oxygenase subunit alpha [Nocardioides aquiterrae]|uniref:Aromatic ring-hydroxylating dioxygenase subunit alpha n=1 Tax=Nocardioides aquiterrae TaxID=203799 RepID=A0ABP4ESF5_9ACTN
MTTTDDTRLANEPDVMDDVKRWSRRNAELGTSPLTTDRFISEEWFERERTELFGKSWINLGSVHDLQGANSFFTRDIVVLDKQVVVTMDADGEIRAFHNVCSHRGMKLMWEDAGVCPSAMVCRFHGWAYGQDGSVKSVPDEGEFHFESRADIGLVPIRTEVWNGFVFVNFDDSGTTTLREHLGPLGEKFENFPFDVLRLAYRYDISERANWKVAVDAQNEIYHVPMLAPVHRFLAQGAFASNDDGYTRLHDFARMGLHTRYTSVSEEYEETPFSQALIDGNPGWGAEQLLPLDDPFEFHVLFPNMVMSFFGNMMFTYNFWPIDVNHVVWEIRLHFPEPANLADLVSREFGAKRFRDLLCEDKTGHEAIHRGCESEARPHIFLGDQEVQIRAFHRSVDDYLEGKHA